MKVLFVAEIGSIHVARWVNQLKDTGWDYRVFEPLPVSTNVRSEIRATRLYLPFETSIPKEIEKGVEIEYTIPQWPLSGKLKLRTRILRKSIKLLVGPVSLLARILRKSVILSTLPITFIAKVFRKGLRLLGKHPSPKGLLERISNRELFEPLYSKRLDKEYMFRVLHAKFIAKEEKTSSLFDLHATKLADLIYCWKPDVIHSLGMFVNWQNNSLALLEARNKLGGKFPCPWIVSSWGADLDLYPHLGETQWEETEAVMSSCDGLIIEGNRDIALAQKLGFHGLVLEKLPAFGGVTWKPEDICLPGPVSKRRVIVLKGRDNTDDVTSGGDPQGRAMTAMRAFELCQDVLQPYSIVIVQATPAIEQQAKILQATTTLKIAVFPNSISFPYKQWLNLLGTAKVVIAVTASDGLPSTLVEAISLGVFPIHSGLEIIRDWIQDGKNGFLVSPDDIHAVARALRTALVDDELVDNAAKINAKIIANNFSDPVVRSRVIRLYENLPQLC